MEEQAIAPKKKSYMNLGVYIPLLFFIFFVGLGFIQHGTDGWIDLVLVNLFFIMLGCQGVVFGFMHIIKPDWTAKNIGWEKSPFQYEIGFAGIAIASLGLVSYWLHDLFWVATAIAAIIFYWGCASGHIRDMIKLKNFNPGNAGYVFWWDILMPLAIIILLLIKNYS